MKGKIVKIAGPVVVAAGMRGVQMFEVVRVGEEGLIGEVIKLEGDLATIQVYEETAGIGPGAPVETTGEPLSVELGPGIITGIYDGILRPLPAIQKASGDFIARGLSAPALDRKKKWEFIPKVKKGAKVTGGQVIGIVKETSMVEHKVMVPPKMSGEITDITKGSFTVEDTICKI